MTEKKQTMSLSGEWELCYTQIGTGRLEKIDTLFAERTISCPVPGDVHMALTSAGIIKEPLLDQNSLNCRWIEEQEFWYRKRFVLSEDFIQDKTKLVFEGLDTTADIWLNGMYIGSNSNAFVEKVIDVSNCVEKGENVLVVRIDDGHHAVKDRPVDLMKYSWNAEQPSNTNTYRFMSEYDIIGWEVNNGDDLWRLFDTEEKNPDRLPANSTLRRCYIKHLKNGGRVGCGFGVRL